MWAFIIHIITVIFVFSLLEISVCETDVLYNNMKVNGLKVQYYTGMVEVHTPMRACECVRVCVCVCVRACVGGILGV